MKMRIASLLGLIALIACPVTSRAEWVAYNDHIAGAIGTETSPNATTNDMRVAGGPYTLKNITNGTTIPDVTMTVSVIGGSQVPGTLCVSPRANTPLYNVFNGFCYFEPNTIMVMAAQMITVTFSNLNPTKVYKLQAGAIRGSDFYTNRWTKCNVLGADRVTPNHQQAADSPYGMLTTNNTSGLLSDYEVAFNSGANLCGDMVEWDNIYPGADGSFSFTSTQLLNTNAVNSHGTNAGTFTPFYDYAFAIAAFRLEEMAPPPTPPNILTQPLSQTNTVGDAVTFNIDLTGSYPLMFQWCKDGVAIADATNQSYSISYLLLGDAGTYSVAVTNDYGYAISSNAVLSVINQVPINIVTEPQSQAVGVGQPVTFSLEATGTYLHYQWQKNGSDIPNATNASYTIPAVTPSDGASYSVRVTNYLSTFLSRDAVLTVLTNPTALFIARTNLSSADQAITNLLGSQGFLVFVADARNVTSNSVAANLCLNKSLVVISSSANPTNVKWFAGSGITVPVVSYGSDNWSQMFMCSSYGRLTNQTSINIVDNAHPLAAGLSGLTQVYQNPQDLEWGIPGGNAIVIAVATNNIGNEMPVLFGYERNARNLTATFPSRRVGVFLGNNSANSLSSAGINLFKAAVDWAMSPPITNAPVGISRQPVNISVPEGSPAFISVNATGAVPYYFTWRRNGTTVYNSYNRLYTVANPTAADNGAQFSVVVTNRYGRATSEVAVLTVLPPLPIAITQQVSNRMVDLGQNATFSVAITGTAPYYQWYHNGTAIAGANTNTYVVTGVDSSDLGDYYVVITNRASSVTSSVAQLSLYPAPVTALADNNNEWRYNTNGTVPAGWAASNFNDTSWPAGSGVFNGAVGAQIALPSGTPRGTILPIKAPNGSNIMTFYFRNKFIFTNSPDDVTVTASMLLDDGAVLYINGVEAARDNMPAGTITSTTPAASSVPLASSWHSYTIDSYSLIQGTNTLAVELHQSTMLSTDVVMGVRLTLDFIRPTPLIITNQPASVVAEATHPVTLSVGVSGIGAKYQWYKDGQAIPGVTGKSLTLTNTSANDVGGYYVTASNFLSYVVSQTAYVSVLPDTLLPNLLEADGSNAPANILLTFSEPVLPDAATNVASYVISNLTDGTCLKIYKAVMAGSSNVLLTTSPRLDRNNYIVFTRNVYDLSSNLVQNIAPVSILHNLISPFSYYDFYLPYPPYDEPCIGEEWCRNNWQLPATWGNNDSLRGTFWSGSINLPVAAGWEISPSSAVVNYFRTPFQFEGSPLNASIKWRHLVDAGAIFYLNCEELARFNVPNGAFYCTNVANLQITAPTWSAWMDLPFARLQPTNLMAIELHSKQAWETHLAMAVDMQARIYSYAHGPIMITRQPEDQTVFEGQPVTFQFMAAGPKSWQWFLNGVPVTAGVDGSYVIPSAWLSLNGSTLYAIATNDTSSVTTRVSTLTVLPSQGLSGNSIQFSKIGGQTCLWWTGNNFVLECTKTLAASPGETVWTPIDTLGNKYYWIAPGTSSNLFYRLRQ